MSTPPTDRAATVWSSTFVPATSPITGADGYSVAWVDTETERLQVLVDGARPAPGTAGRLTTRTVDDEAIAMFVTDAS
ncbi:hypothetical protein [Mycobacterium sp. SMC-4]|uniref:hypothetical protein n=1 Tax=Mycobacterium sp. SMC-4 TaxID=2857059 RepID=UPI0021B4126B|nr:hypothetical protein [Mycobacterium sp. SMC-4]UXA19253.1 hypothetical protein KXD98_06385 [Mycobacterium sp. SMC-4]